MSGRRAKRMRRSMLDEVGYLACVSASRPYYLSVRASAYWIGAHVFDDRVRPSLRRKALRLSWQAHALALSERKAAMEDERRPTFTGIIP